jgi:hypothetical protein
MAERWRKAVVPLAIAEHEHESIWLPDGRQQRQSILTLTEDDVERMRLGYVCMKCLEPFEIAWPERCHVCGAPVRTKQAEFFALEHDPHIVDLRPTDWSDEIESLDERVRKEGT